MTLPSCSLAQISYKVKVFGDSDTNKGQIAYFFILHARNGLISTSCQKSDDPDFL